jgi:hypothetical protein
VEPWGRALINLQTALGPGKLVGQAGVAMVSGTGADDEC